MATAQLKQQPKTRRAALALVADVMRQQNISVADVEALLARNPTRQRNNKATDFIIERRGGALYAYIPLGRFVVAAAGVCGGRPTIHGTRIDARHVFAALQTDTPARVAREYGIALEAIKEVVELANSIDYEKAYA